jgi:methyl-accepting chemotaxis protein
VQQSNQAGEAIRLLADGVVQSAQAATQIAVSAQQQLAGMDQLVLAMENIRGASNQNVLSAKQAEQAAQNLHELGLKLQGMLSRYRV